MESSQDSQCNMQVELKPSAPPAIPLVRGVPGDLPFQDGSTLPDFEQNYILNAIIERIERGVNEESSLITKGELGWFMSEIANHLMRATLMKGQVAPLMQKIAMANFMRDYPMIVRNHYMFKDLSDEEIHDQLVAKLSRKLSDMRHHSNGPASSSGRKNNRANELAKKCRPGQRADRSGRVAYKPSGKEEEMRVQLVERFDDPEYDQERTWELWDETLMYRRAEVGECSWVDDPENPGYLKREGVRNILLRWPHFRRREFMAYDFDFVTNYPNAANAAMANFKRFKYLALLFFSTTKSGVMKYRSNSRTLKKQDRIQFEMGLPEILSFTSEIWSVGSDLPESSTDEGRMLRMIPIYALFERFNVYPVTKTARDAKRKNGIVIEEIPSGRKVLNQNVNVYKVFVEGLEVLQRDNELISAVLTSVMASYTLDMPLPGQLISDEGDIRYLPKPYMALMKAIFQNSDGTGSYPRYLEQRTQLKAQARSIVEAINKSPMVVRCSPFPKGMVFDQDGGGNHGKSTDEGAMQRSKSVEQLSSAYRKRPVSGGSSVDFMEKAASWIIEGKSTMSASCPRLSTSATSVSSSSHKSVTPKQRWKQTSVGDPYTVCLPDEMSPSALSPGQNSEGLIEEMAIDQRKTPVALLQGPIPNHRCLHNTPSAFHGRQSHDKSENVAQQSHGRLTSVKDRIFKPKGRKADAVSGQKSKNRIGKKRQATRKNSAVAEEDSDSSMTDEPWNREDEDSDLSDFCEGPEDLDICGDGSAAVGYSQGGLGIRVDMSREQGSTKGAGKKVDVSKIYRQRMDEFEEQKLAEKKALIAELELLRAHAAKSKWSQPPGDLQQASDSAAQGETLREPNNQDPQETEVPGESQLEDTAAISDNDAENRPPTRLDVICDTPPKQGCKRRSRRINSAYSNSQPVADHSIDALLHQNSGAGRNMLSQQVVTGPSPGKSPNVKVRRDD